MPSTTEQVAALLTQHRCLSAAALIELLPGPIEPTDLEGAIDDPNALELPNGHYAWMPSLLDGLTLTHRLTRLEIERGEVDLEPNLDVFLRAPAPDGFEFTAAKTLRGPLGWLDGYDAGALVAVRLESGTLSVTSPAVEDAIAAVRLRSIFDAQDVESIEPAELVLTARATDAELFCAPTLPLTDLVALAGLEQRYGHVGVAGRAWRSPLERYVQDKYGLEDCCLKASLSVLGLFAIWLAAERNVPANVLTLAAESLVHGAANGVLCELGPKTGGDDLEPVGAFAGAVAAVSSGAPAAAARFVQAVVSDRGGDIRAAERHLAEALRIDRACSPALHMAAELAEVRGDAPGAVSLLRRAGATDTDPDIRRLEPFMPRRAMGRNVRCPCGSGRKYKACCERTGGTIRERAIWLWQKAGAFVALHGHDQLWRLRRASQFDDDTLLVELALFEEGLLGRFVDARAALLPLDELALARSWVGCRRRLVRVESTNPDGELGLRDLADDQRIIVHDTVIVGQVQPDELVFARVVPGPSPSGHMMIGVPWRCSLEDRDTLLPLLRGGYSALDLVAWFNRSPDDAEMPTPPARRS